MKTGLRDAGYVYVNIDDNWSQLERDNNGFLQEDLVRFPRKMKWLADYIHELGLKFGMYTDVGVKTCQGYPSLLKPGAIATADSEYEDLFYVSDIDMFIDWGIDALKVDGCNVHSKRDDQFLYPKLSEMILDRLARKGKSAGSLQLEGAPLELVKPPMVRPILLSCSWPAYMPDQGLNEATMASLAHNCNLWRNYGDIQDSWSSVMAITDFYAKNSMGPNTLLVQTAGPGHWNDPDMLVVGNTGLSPSEEQTQMALWAILAAPLYISADIRKMDRQALAILKNPKVIAVNQDPLGKQGWVIHSDPTFRVWMRPLVDNKSKKQIALLVENKRAEFYYSMYHFDPALVGVVGSYTMEDLYGNAPASTHTGPVSIKVDANCSAMFKISFDLQD